MKTKRRNEDSVISFLDIICCGFGAIVLLLLLIKTGGEGALRGDNQDKITSTIKRIQEEIYSIRGETDVAIQELNAKQEQLSQYKERIAILRLEQEKLLNELQSSDNIAGKQQAEKQQYELALQQLTETIKNLVKKDDNDYIGGVPVDSEYIIFIIDTSGSMASVAWGRLLREVEDILSIYPDVKGIQVMNDMGNYMYNSYANRWIPDSPKRRQLIIKTLTNWRPFSNSSPVEGITAAIKTYYSPKHKISLYVMGDDFSGNINGVLKQVVKLNPKNAQGESLVRIHAIGFPVAYSQARQTNQHFASLMRNLAEQNSGAFVGLNSNN